MCISCTPYSYLCVGPSVWPINRRICFQNSCVALSAAHHLHVCQQHLPLAALVSISHLDVHVQLSIAHFMSLTSCGTCGVGTKHTAFGKLVTIPTLGPLCVVSRAMEVTSWDALEAKRVSLLDLMGHRVPPQTIVPHRSAASLHCSMARP